MPIIPGQPDKYNPCVNGVVEEVIAGVPKRISIAHAEVLQESLMEATRNYRRSKGLQDKFMRPTVKDLTMI
jgi:hypothetical protein